MNRSSKNKVATWMPATQRLVEQPLWVNRVGFAMSAVMCVILDTGHCRSGHSACSCVPSRLRVLAFIDPASFD